MAEEVKKRGRKPKATNIVTEPQANNNDNRDDIINQLMAQLAEQNAKMAELQAQINSQPTTIIQQANTFNSKKIKVIRIGLQNTETISVDIG